MKKGIFGYLSLKKRSEMLSGTMITVVQHSSPLLPMREPEIFHPRADLQSCSRFLSFNLPWTSAPTLLAKDEEAHRDRLQHRYGTGPWDGIRHYSGRKCMVLQLLIPDHTYQSQTGEHGVSAGERTHGCPASVWGKCVNALWPLVVWEVW